MPQYDLHMDQMRAEKWNEEMELEMSVLHEAFDHRKELGACRWDHPEGRADCCVFYSGNPLNSDTYVVHFEKAFPDMQGAYPMINQQFVLHACENYTYVNREEDTGDPGLRKAKMSYYPEILLKKYVRSQVMSFLQIRKETGKKSTKYGRPVLAMRRNW